MRTAAATVPVLDITDLRVVYSSNALRRGHDVVAVDGVSLHVDAGEIVGLVGESGSGKTTLAMAAAMLGTITEGSVRLQGVELTELTKSRLRRVRSDVQVVFQDPHGSLDPRQSVRKGLSELRSLHRDRTDWITDDDLMDRVGLTPDILDRFPHEVSGGQAQRVSIARALLLRPALLVADEPTSSLDVSVQAQILKLLLRLRADEQIAVLFISHDLSVVHNVCDRVYVMKDGVVVEHGETEVLLGNPTQPYTRELIDAVPGKEWVVHTAEDLRGGEVSP